MTADDCAISVNTCFLSTVVSALDLISLLLLSGVVLLNHIEFHKFQIFKKSCFLLALVNKLAAILRLSSAFDARMLIWI